MADPTTDPITTVKTNIGNMQLFNDYVYNHGDDLLLNACGKLSEGDDSDPGLEFGLSLLEVAFDALSELVEPVGPIASVIFAGIVQGWESDTPTSLMGDLAKLAIRMEQSNLELDTQLAHIATNPEEHWDDEFSFGGRSYKVSDLAGIDFPVETDDDFMTMATAALRSLDQTIWQMFLVDHMVVTYYTTQKDVIVAGDSGDDSPARSFAESEINAHPAYYYEWEYRDDSGCGATPGWWMKEYNVGTGYSGFSDGSLSEDACSYLFIDSISGVVINASGLFYRNDVFNNLGLAHTEHDFPHMAAPANRLSFAYLRAMKTGRTLGHRVSDLGRAEMERLLIEKAHEDSCFLNRLRKEPRAAIEDFFDMKIPDVVDLQITVEDSRTFGLIIPQKS